MADKRCETCRHFPNDGRFNHCNAPLPEWTYHAPFPYSGRHHGTSSHDSEVHKDFGTDCSTWRAKTNGRAQRPNGRKPAAS